MCKERSRKRGALQAAQKDKDSVQAEIWDIEVRARLACVRECACARSCVRACVRSACGWPLRDSAHHH